MKRQHTYSNSANSSLRKSHLENQQATSYENPISQGDQFQDTSRSSRDSQQKVLIDAGSADSASYLDTQTFASFRPDSPSNAPLADRMMNQFFIPDDLPSHQNTSWPNIDPMMKMPMLPAGNESRMSQPSFTPQNCSCNG
jgi:hypothetical protein